MAAAGFVVVEMLLVDRPSVVLLLRDAIHHYQGVCSAVDRSGGDDGSGDASSAAACSFTTATASGTFFPPADCCIQSFFSFGCLWSCSIWFSFGFSVCPNRSKSSSVGKGRTPVCSGLFL